MNEEKIYQLVIIGAGPGGLTAGLYASRARIDTILVEKAIEGGQILVTDWIDNYPGFPEGVSGFELAEKMKAQAMRFGLSYLNNSVASMALEEEIKTITFEDGTAIQARAVIVATGARPNKLNVPGEKELAGKGVSYCATCDGPFYRDLNIAVVGGGDTAVQEAVYLTKFAKSVTVIHRRDELRAAPILQEEAFAHPQVAFQCDAEVIEIIGEKGVESLKVKHSDGTEEVLPFDGVFILIGVTPNNEMLPPGQLEMENGFIITDCMMQTSLAGVMAIGDIRHNSIRQVVSAAGDGAVAEKAVEHYLDTLRQKKVLVVERKKCSQHS
nr:thioredoxin-disulfide reductase [Desulfobulbaceae bacterium]